MTSKKQLCMFLSVAVASAVAQAQSPDSGLTLSLDVPGVMVVESVLEGDGVNPLLSEGEALNPPAVVELQPAKIERSVLEFPQIRAMPVATPVGSTPKARLASHGVENAVTATNEAGTESVNEVTGKAELIRQRFPNGKPQIERWVIEDSLGNIVNHGKYVEYDGKGAIVVSGTYSLGKREGEWTKQITDTQVVSLVGRHDKAFAAPFTSRANFKQGKLDGEWTIVDGKGRLVSEWSYTRWCSQWNVVVVQCQRGFDAIGQLQGKSCRRPWPSGAGQRSCQRHSLHRWHDVAAGRQVVSGSGWQDSSIAVAGMAIGSNAAEYCEERLGRQLD